MEMKSCAHCNKPLDSNRKKFCRDFCKYWFNQIKKEKEKHLPPFKKRNQNYFSMTTGHTHSMRGQGKRSGGMIKGGMAAMVSWVVAQWAEVNYENLKRHFTSIKLYRPQYIRLGDGERVKEKDIYKKFGIRIDF